MALYGKDRLPGPDAISKGYLQLVSPGNGGLHPRAKADHAYPLPPEDVISGLDITDDFPHDGPGDLAQLDLSVLGIDSHPAQIANIGDRVNFSLHTDGTPTNIKWNFGTSDDIECSDRSCASVPMFFNTAGTYTITATITYKDLNTSTATTKLIVEK